MHQRYSAIAVIAAAALLGSCGSGSPRAHVIPTLPGDGAAHTAKPADAPSQPPAPPDPWANRDDLITSPTPEPPRELELPALTRFTLKNGLPVIVIKQERLPVVGMQLAIKAGNADSPREKMGLAELTASMLNRGTRTRNAVQIAETIETVGGSLQTATGYENTVISCSVMSRDLNTCLTLVPDILVNPTFPQAEIDKVRRELHALVRQRLDDAGQLAEVHVRNLLWGDEHPRGWPMTARTIDAIERADLVAWHKSWFVPQNALLVVAGDVDPTAVKARLEQVFWNWRGPKPPARTSYQEPALAGSKLRLIDKPDQTQSHIRVAQLGIAHGDPAFLDHQVMNYVLGGGGFSARLMRVVRSEGGKTYGAWSYFDRDRVRGSFVAGTFTRTAETVATTRLVLQELARMKEQGATEVEVRDAITNLGGSYAADFETTLDVARQVLLAELRGLGDQYLRTYPVRVSQVTVDSVRAAAGATLTPDRLAVVIVGNAKEIEPQLKQAGWPYEKIGYLAPVTGFEREAAKLGVVDPAAEKAGRELLDKALAAKGGAARLTGLKSMVMSAQGKIALGPQELSATFTRSFSAPDKLRMDIDIQVGGNAVQVVTVLNGDKAWNKQPQTGVKELPADALAELKRQLWRDQELILTRHKEAGARVAALGEKTVDGRTLLAVRVVQPARSVDATLYLDPKTYLPVRMSYSDASGETVEIYDDYKPVGGIQVAHRRVTRSPEANLDVQVTSMTFDQPFDASRFTRPQ